MVSNETISLPEIPSEISAFKPQKKISKLE